MQLFADCGSIFAGWETYYGFMSLSELFSTLLLCILLIAAISIFNLILKRAGTSLIHKLIFAFGLWLLTSLLVWLLWFLGAKADDPTTPFSIDIILECLWWFSLNLLVIRILDFFVWNKFFLRRGVAVSKILKDLISLVVLVITVAAIVHFVFNRSVLGIFTASGVVAIILGYSAQATLSDVFAGLGLNSAKQFSEGDWIRINGLGATLLGGKVIDINWRFVNLLTQEGNNLSIPNSVIAKLAIINISQPTPTRGVVLAIPAPGGFSPEVIKNIFLSAAEQCPKVLKEPPPQATLLQNRGTDYMYQLIYYTKEVDEIAVNDEIQSIIWYQYGRKGIKTSPHEMPAPDVYAQSELEEFLQKMDLFSCLMAEEISTLAEHCNYQSYGPPERILAQNQKNESLFIIYKGSVNVNIATETQPIVLVATLNAGQYFGEMSLLTGDPVSASIVVNTESVIIQIDHDIMANIFSNRPELIDKMSEIVILRKQKNEDVRSLLMKEKNKEQVKLISRLANRVRDFYKRVTSI